MRKNQSGQIVGAQMVSASNGSAFTGSVTVYVTGDGGTQAAGSVGSGACTHEGNGFHSYAPSQGESNYDHVAFTFVGTGAVPTTVQVYTSYPQTGDNYTRLGAPAGASVSADIAAVQTDTNDIQGRLPAALVSGRMDASVGAMATDVLTSGALASSAVTEIQSGLSTLDAAGVRSAVGLASANLDTQLATVAGYIDTEVAAIKAKTDNLPADPADASDIAAAFSTVNGTLAALSGYVDTEVAAIKLVTDKLHTTLEIGAGSPGEYRFSADALVNAPSGTGGGGGGGGPSAAEIASAVWAEALPGSYGAGEAGKIVGDSLDAAITSRASQSSLNTVAGYVDTEVAAILAAVDTEVAAIKAKTDLIPASPAAAGDIPTAAAVADAVWDEASSGHAGAGSFGKALADADDRGARTVLRGTVGDASTPSTTQFTPSAMDPAGASADQFKGRIIIFDKDTATAALRGEATDITASSNAALPLFTFTALTSAPADGDTFTIV